MISAKQLKKVLDYSFTAGSNFVAPTCDLFATPGFYTINNVPASVTISGTITPNDGTVTGWSLKDHTNTTVLVGTGNIISYVDSGGINPLPTTTGSYTYTLTVNYTDNNLASQSMICLVNLLVTSSSLYGTYTTNTPVLDLVTYNATPAIEAGLTVTDQNTIINLFDVVVSGVEQVFIIVPDSYGTVLDIADENDSSVITEFTTIPDPSNSRTIYARTTTLTSNTYQYKVIFS